ncbi:ABC transporter permease [Lentibacillus jeotgali]|uniref:ABC transporter permease n=1 Tax=Lentibacillus jeotgali TaxID=558169 RepID=UPI0002DB4B65|nr:ABC transporter permease [Lentibacillus jeotgali]
MQWWTLFQKELIENIRNVKWIWVPLIMILIAIMDPLTNYYLPQIIEATGGMPDGAEIQLPDYQPSDVVMMSIGQFNTIGVLIMALISMGTIAGERKNGVSERQACFLYELYYRQMGIICTSDTDQFLTRNACQLVLYQFIIR